MSVQNNNLLFLQLGMSVSQFCAWFENIVVGDIARMKGVIKNSTNFIP